MGHPGSELFRPRPGRRPGAVGTPPTLLYHGRIDVRKGVMDLLEAVRLLLADGRRLRLLVSGTGPDLDRLTRDRLHPLRHGISGPAGGLPRPASRQRGNRTATGPDGQGRTPEARRPRNASGRRRTSAAWTNRRSAVALGRHRHITPAMLAHAFPAVAA